jgi:carboxyl-terminal processing protease
VFLEFADKYAERHIAELKNTYGTDVARFADRFQVTDEMLEQILGLAKGKKIEFKKDLYEKDLSYVKSFAKAYLARRIWGNEGSSRVMLTMDAQFKEAMTLFPEAEKISRSLSSLR